MSATELSSLDASEMTEINEPSQWLAKALKAHPEILEVVERSRSLKADGESFGMRLSTATTEGSHSLSHYKVMQLILEFLDDHGYSRTIEKLEKDTLIHRMESQSSNQTLQKMLEMGIKDASSALDRSMMRLEDAGFNGDDAEVEVFDFQPSFDTNDDNVEDIHIWSEGPQTDNNLVLGHDESNKSDFIISGTNNKIIEAITGAQQVLSDRQLVLATYQSWCTPEQFFEKLLQRYDVPTETLKMEPEEINKLVKDVGTRVMLVLKTWMSQYPDDFSDRLIERVRDFVEVRLVQDGRHDLAKNLRSPLAKLREASTGKEHQSLDVSQYPDPKVPKNIFCPTLTLDDVPTEEIARQMTIIDAKLYTKIKAMEFFSRNWCKSRYIRTSAVAGVLNRFNNVVKWVITSVLQKTNYKERAEVIRHFLEIAQALMGMQSYNSMAAIYYGVTHGAVYRLTHTFNELRSQSRQILKTLSQLLDPSDGYVTYMEEFNRHNPPKIPFIGAHLHEISLIDEIEPDDIGLMINLAKRKKIYEKIVPILKCQSITLKYLPVKQISVFLHKFDLIRSENEMYKQSVQREPKGISITDLVDYENSNRE